MEWETAYHWHTKKTVDVNFALACREKGGRIEAGDCWCHEECYNQQPRIGCKIGPRIASARAGAHFWLGSKSQEKPNNCHFEQIRKEHKESHRYAQFYHDIRQWLNAEEAKTHLSFTVFHESKKSKYSDFTIQHILSEEVTWKETKILIIHKNRKRTADIETRIVIDLSQWTMEHISDFENHGKRKVIEEFKQLIARQNEQRKKQDKKRESRTERRTNTISFKDYFSQWFDKRTETGWKQIQRFRLINNNMRLIHSEYNHYRVINTKKSDYSRLHLRVLKDYKSTTFEKEEAEAYFNNNFILEHHAIVLKHLSKLDIDSCDTLTELGNWQKNQPGGLLHNLDSEELKFDFTRYLQVCDDTIIILKELLKRNREEWEKQNKNYKQEYKNKHLATIKDNLINAELEENRIEKFAKYGRYPADRRKWDNAKETLKNRKRESEKTPYEFMRRILDENSGLVFEAEQAMRMWDTRKKYTTR
jgi:hypothetical protein